MVNDVYNLKWKFFTDNQDSALEELFTKNNNQADVTLVSDDKVAFPVHKFVIGACSPVLKDLLTKNPHPHPMIYLNGVKQFELNSILRFIYFGKTQVFQSRMEKFFETGKELKIKQLSHPFIPNNEHEVKDFSDIEPGNKVDNIPKGVHAQDKGVLLEYDVDDGKQVVDYDRNGYRCEACKALFNSKLGLIHHRRNKHEGVRYSCDICHYKAKSKDNLKTHKDSIHEGVRYSCDSCVYKATTKSDLKKHKDSIHEGVRYSCDCCDYKATRISHLRTHKQAKHKDMN